MGDQIDCPILIQEMGDFIVKESGRSEAMSGKHDDNVMMAAIGLTVISGATMYRTRSVKFELPPDIARMERERKRGMVKDYSFA